MQNSMSVHVHETILIQNENRGKLMSELEESTCAMFTGTIKISTLGSFGEYYVSIVSDIERSDDEIPCYRTGRMMSEVP